MSAYETLGHIGDEAHGRHICKYIYEDAEADPMVLAIYRIAGSHHSTLV